jgi:ComF family protein
LRGAVEKAGRAALDLLFPPLCLKCRTRVGEPHMLCADCWNEIGFLDGAVCQLCGMPFDIDPGGETVCGPCHAQPRAFAKARALMRYDDASRGLILAFKYDRLHHTPAFGAWLERAGRELLVETDTVVPVPLHRWRLWKRRYNQAAILGERLSRLSGVEFDPFALCRKRPTPSQGKMPSAKARRRNVLGAFEVPPEAKVRIKGRRILLVDDVFTTGATLEACTRALKRGGAAQVQVLTLARVVKPA